MRYGEEAVFDELFETNLVHRPAIPSFALCQMEHPQQAVVVLHPSRRRREAEQDEMRIDALHPFQNLLITRHGRMMRLVDDNDELFLARIPKHPADMAHAVLRCHGQDGSDRDVIPDRHRHRRMLAGDRQQLDARNAVVCERRCELAELAERLLDELLPMHEPDDAVSLCHALR